MECHYQTQVQSQASMQFGCTNCMLNQNPTQETTQPTIAGASSSEKGGEAESNELVHLRQGLIK